MKWIILPLLWLVIVLIAGLGEVVCYLWQVLWCGELKFNPIMMNSWETQCNGWKHLMRGPIHYVYLGQDDNHGYGSEN